MAEKFEIEIGDNGRPTAALPEPLQAFFESQLKEASARAARDAKKSLPSPADLERMRQLEEEVQSFQVKEAVAAQEWQKARELMEAKAAKERGELSTALEAERQRARTLAQRTFREQVRAAALQHGLDGDDPTAVTLFLNQVMATPNIEFDPTHEYLPVLKTQEGVIPLDVEAFTKDEVKKYPRLLRAPAPGGGARGGASGMGMTADLGKQAAYDAALAAFSKTANGETLRALQEAKRAMEN